MEKPHERDASESALSRRAPHILRAVERALLIVVALLTVMAVGLELAKIAASLTITLADILLMFLYAEVIGMVSVFYTSRTIVVIYPIFIAITALARLIVLQGKDMDPINILYEAVAIFILALAVLILGRRRED